MAEVAGEVAGEVEGEVEGPAAGDFAVGDFRWRSRFHQDWAHYFAGDFSRVHMLQVIALRGVLEVLHSVGIDAAETNSSRCRFLQVALPHCMSLLKRCSHRVQRLLASRRGQEGILGLACCTPPQPP